MIINADDPSPGVQMVAEGDLDVDGEVTPVQGEITVAMSAVTVLTADTDIQSQFLSAQSGLTVTPS